MSVPPILDDLEMRAWQALLHTHHKVIRRLDQELRHEHDLPVAAYDVLLRLRRAPDRRLGMSELAQRVMLSPSGVTRTVDRLVGKGLVYREDDSRDGRAALTVLTDEGARVLKKAAATHLRGIREHFTGRLSRSQLRMLASVLETVAGPHTPH